MKPTRFIALQEVRQIGPTGERQLVYHMWGVDPSLEKLKRRVREGLREFKEIKVKFFPIGEEIGEISKAFVFEERGFNE